MRKKIFAIFLSLFCMAGAYADSEKEFFIYPDVLEYVVNDWVFYSTDIAEEQMDTFIDVFRNSLSDAGTFTASKLRSAAAAAKIEGDDFTQLLDVLLTVFHDSCKLNSDYDKCMKGFEPFAVRLPEGVALAKDYIKHNYKIDVVCSAEPRREGGLHYLRCSSLNNKYWFELPFAALNEVKDDVILHGVLGAVGKIHNADLLTGISAVSAIAKDGDDGFAAYNVSDAAKCSQINETLNKLGYQSKVVKNSKVKQNYVNHINTIYGTNDFVLNTYAKSGIVHPDNVSNDLCEVSGIVLSENDLKTAFNIDNMAFLGVTAQMGDMTVDKYVENYVRNHMTKNGYTLSSFSCAESTSHAFVKGERDEILKCYVNGQEVDFVFNDLSEWKRSFRKSGKQRMDCAIIGGVYSGEDCLGLDKDLCLKLRDANIESCPECKLVEWDPHNNICVMPESARANLHEKSVNIALIAGGTAFSMVVSVAMGEHPVIIFVEAAGGVIEMISQYKIEYIADGFLVESNSCKDAQCAEKLLKENLTRLARVESTINKTDARAIDKEMARLVELIPANSDFYKKVVNKGLSDFDDGLYNAAEIWRAVGIAMQFAGLAKSVGTALMRRSADLANVLPNTTKALNSKLDDVVVVTGKFDNVDEVLDPRFETKLGDAYQKYAPKNQSFDDFKKMFANESEFDEQLAAWSTFTPGYVGKRFRKKYVSSPYSTFDIDLSKQFKSIDSDYVDDITKIDEEIEFLRQDFKQYEAVKKTQLREEKKQVELVATERLGRRPTSSDWEKTELQDLKIQMDDLDNRIYTPHSSDYSPEQFALFERMEELNNLKDGYIVARDYEKAKLINASISDEIQNTIASTRRQELVDIIASDDDLFAQVQNYENLSRTEKESFLQTVHSRYDEVTHNETLNPKVVVYEDPKSSIVANAKREYNDVPMGQKRGTNDILNTIAHEQSHIVDHYAPNLGMLGEQKASVHIEKADITTRYEPKINNMTLEVVEERYKGIEIEDVYHSVPTERAAYSVGGGDTRYDFISDIVEQRTKK